MHQLFEITVDVGLLKLTEAYRQISVISAKVIAFFSIFNRNNHYAVCLLFRRQSPQKYKHVNSHVVVVSATETIPENMLSLTVIYRQIILVLSGKVDPAIVEAVVS